MAAGKARPEQIGGMITKFKATARRARRGRQRPRPPPRMGWSFIPENE
jgi:hypothetical protein